MLTHYWQRLPETFLPVNCVGWCQVGRSILCSGFQSESFFEGWFRYLHIYGIESQYLWIYCEVLIHKRGTLWYSRFIINRSRGGGGQRLLWYKMKRTRRGETWPTHSINGGLYMDFSASQMHPHGNVCNFFHIKVVMCAGRAALPHYHGNTITSRPPQSQADHQLNM